MSDDKNDPAQKDRRSMPERTMPFEDAARTCGVSVDTLRRWISDGKIRAYRVGPRRIRVETDDIDAMFKPIGPGA